MRKFKRSTDYSKRLQISSNCIELSFRFCQKLKINQHNPVIASNFAMFNTSKLQNACRSEIVHCLLEKLFLPSCLYPIHPKWVPQNMLCLFVCTNDFPCS